MIYRILYVLNVIRLVAALAWKTSETGRFDNLAYGCFKDSHGMPKLVVVVGQGRDAWRVSNFAVEALTKCGG